MRLFMFTLAALAILLFACSDAQQDERNRLADQIEISLRTELLAPWYPQAIDTVHGGFLSTFTHDFKPAGEQEKMIVSQARHVWTNARASQRYPQAKGYKANARHGFVFLHEVMWDKTHGGFHTMVDRAGNVKSAAGEEKTAYGNAFGLYAAAAYYKATNDKRGLSLAKKTFAWLEKHSHDPLHKGYFQHMRVDGTPYARPDTIVSTSELGYKDQNSSIHLLEAFTELYQVWPDPLVRERLLELLTLIRDTITTPKGYMVLFFSPDWKPISYRDSSDAVIQQHHALDHVSFGHDVETAYLMLEASHIAGLENDTLTLAVAKRMVDHALRNGWDNANGGFYDEAYYFSHQPGITITRDTKNWWAQAEGLNTLLLMADHFPDDSMQYFARFKTLWQYIQINLIDHHYGDWYAGGLDKQPDMKNALKGHLWKATYHQYRAMDNCIERLRKNE